MYDTEEQELCLRFCPSANQHALVREGVGRARDLVIRHGGGEVQCGWNALVVELRDFGGDGGRRGE